MDQTPRSSHSTEKAYPTLVAIACTVALFLFATNCVFSNVTALSYITLCAFFAFAVITTRSKPVMIALAIPAALGLLWIPITSLSLFFAGIGIIAIVATTIRNKQYGLLLALPVAYGVCIAVSGDPLPSLGAFFFLPPALVMGILLQKKAKRGTLVAATAGSLLLIPAVTLIAFAYNETGTVSLSFFTDYIGAFRDALIPEMVALFEEVGLANTEEALLAGFNAVVRLLPALCIILCEILAYLASMLAIQLADTDKEHPLPLHTRFLRMETTSAVVFLAALLFYFLLQGMDGNAGVLWISALNLVLILAPGLALQELMLFVERFRARRAGILLPLLLFFFTGMLFPLLLALLGAFHLIRESRIRRKGNGDNI